MSFLPHKSYTGNLEPCLALLVACYHTAYWWGSIGFDSAQARGRGGASEGMRGRGYGRGRSRANAKGMRESCHVNQLLRKYCTPAPSLTSNTALNNPTVFHTQNRFVVVDPSFLFGSGSSAASCLTSVIDETSEDPETGRGDRRAEESLCVDMAKRPTLPLVVWIAVLVFLWNQFLRSTHEDHEDDLETSTAASISRRLEVTSTIEGDDECELSPARYSNAPIRPVLLASYPGSGTQMTRILISQLTHIQTESMWDSSDRRDRVVAIKTHYPFSGVDEYLSLTEDIQFDRAILVLRSPLQSIPSFFNQLYERRHNLVCRRITIRLSSKIGTNE